jgi:hypothetical protein
MKEEIWQGTMRWIVSVNTSQGFGGKEPVQVYGQVTNLRHLMPGQAEELERKLRP